MVKAITFVGAGTVFTEAAASTATINLSYPAGIRAGDVAIVWHAANTSTAASTPTGYTVVGQLSSGGQLNCWRRTLLGNETTVSFGRNGSSKATAVVLVYRDVDQENPIDVAFNSNASTTMPSVTTVTPGAFICFAGRGLTVSGDTTNSWASTNGNIRGQGTGTGGAITNTTMGVGDLLRATVGTTTPVLTVTLSPTNPHRASFALKPAPSKRGWRSG